MPFLYWVDSERYVVATQWKRDSLTAFEKEAKEIENLVDDIFDKSLVKLNEYIDSYESYSSHKEFFRDYAVGRTIIDSNILDHEYIVGDGSEKKPRELLVDTGNIRMIIDKGENIAFYTAIGVKANLGKSINFEDKNRWKKLRPTRKDATKGGTKRAGGKRDIYARAVYLGEQDLESALLTFGGKVDLVAGAFERGLESLKIRNAMASYFKRFKNEEREKFYSRDIRREMYKKLNKIFPRTGPGSSKSPDNYEEKELLETLENIWSEFEN
mgnify:CR=1 FL=1|tara:strand:- start:305 stop:1114 length:810 start_codon:yes stop_codon:yes gene_type:complete